MLCLMVVIALIGYGGYRFYRHEKWQSKQLVSILNEVNEEKNAINNLSVTINEIFTIRESISAYTKIADGLPVYILVVGDSIGAGSGASDYQNSWPMLVKGYIEKSMVQPFLWIIFQWVASLLWQVMLGCYNLEMIHIMI